MARPFAYVIAVLIAVITCTPTIARGQVPDTGMFAAGVDVGVSVPTESELETSTPIGGFIEYYVSPRVSFRPSLFSSEPEIGDNSDVELDSTRFGLDVLYNFERGRWHPFVGAGVGIHRLGIEVNDVDVADGTKLGLDLLGGLEYFVNRDWVIKGEVGYHPVDNLSGWPAPSNVVFTVGAKRYF